MIPPLGWRPMEDAPRDGTVVMVRSREWNNPSAAFQVQPGQWLCDMKGEDWRWRLPYRQGTTIYADGWMTFEEFQQAQTEQQPAPTPDFCPQPAEVPEFDL